MAGSIRIVVNPEGVKALLKSQEVQNMLQQRVNKIAAAAGPGMQASVRVGRTRARGSVITATQEAREAEANDRMLTKSLDAGR